MSAKLGKMERVNVRDAWQNEASHFTPWLALDEGLELLQDALEMDLEVEATEQYIGPFKADIVAKRTDTPDEHWVLIENQLEKTDHLHLGQLLTYAAGLKAATIVWVAERFEEEHRAALDWLNAITSEEFAFYGLEIELWRINDSPPAPMFNVIAQPNEWSREVKHKADNTPSDLKQLQQRYWQTLRAQLLEKKSKVRPQKAHPQHWADFALGRSGAWLTACVNSSKKSISVEFACRGPAGKVWYDQLLAQKAEIEAELGHQLVWRRLDGKKQSRILLFREDTDPTNEADWPAQHAWLIEKLEKFRDVFRPRALALSDGNGSVAEGEVEGNGYDASSEGPEDN